VSDPNWHVLGAGAIGCLFGAALNGQGHGTTLILRNAEKRDSTAVVVQYDGQSSTVQLPVFPLKTTTLLRTSW
jgi:ketopantoate reductase